MNNYKVVEEKIKGSHGFWGTMICRIYQNDVFIGEFTRNYSSFGKDTFAPFMFNGKEYALYSQDYGIIAVMTLPDCKQVTLTPESQKNLQNFCPVECHVPQYYHYSFVSSVSKEMAYAPIDKTDDPEEMAGMKEEDLRWHNFALVAGCVWGDDSSWKLNLLDLRGIEEGKLEYFCDDEKGWLYVEMFGKRSLKDVEISSDYLSKDNFGVHVVLTIPTSKRIAFTSEKMRVKQWD